MNLAEILFEHPSFVVIVISLAACVCNEFIGWVLVYRKDRYKYLKGQLLSGEKRLEVFYLPAACVNCMGNSLCTLL
jgi:hypothetical protein